MPEILFRRFTESRPKNITSSIFTPKNCCIKRLKVKQNLTKRKKNRNIKKSNLVSVSQVKENIKMEQDKMSSILLA